MATKEKSATNPTANTQGRKGEKAARINMAFTKDNYEFLKLISRATGQSMTEQANAIIDGYRRDHPEIMEQAQAVINAIHGTLGTLGGEDE